MEYSNNASNSLVLWMRAIAILSPRIIKTSSSLQEASLRGDDRSPVKAKTRWLRPHFDKAQ
ncbi:hypothetical protein [Nostoc favosum]|uniref:Uncharacterized protein n=1 Tax=Nostoc favosum CHAB5714 TaxID=2780399 RepID=A0ABS8IEJ7_9NOSO|nr:hypothetical protein [Nostoc favosum]MCC5602314.1 hypothetical protein [Nostoc favosum CHAB5714]